MTDSYITPIDPALINGLGQNFQFRISSIHKGFGGELSTMEQIALEVDGQQSRITTRDPELSSLIEKREGDIRSLFDALAGHMLQTPGFSVQIVQ